jgi:hypothetical protein
VPDFRYNKGEWTELYVLGRLLVDGSIDIERFGQVGSTRELKVLEVARTEEVGMGSYAVQGDLIVAGHKLELDRERLRNLVERMPDQIRFGSGQTKDRVFVIETGRELLDLLGISQLKRSGGKSDIYVRVEDPLTGHTGLQGYTIKSFLGSPPTLFNSAKTTNFFFKTRSVLRDSELARLNSISSVRAMFRDLVTTAELEFLPDLLDPTFRQNLELLDSNMPLLLAHVLLGYYSMSVGNVRSLERIVDAVADANPLGYKRPDVAYRLKVMDFLESVALGMVPSRHYEGVWETPGGFLFVGSDGELSCLPLTDRDEHRIFLFRHTQFDTPSRTKFDFGKLFVASGESRIAANLQVRFSPFG